MRNYAGWSLRDRSFATALLISAGWHIFWFVAISVNVTPRYMKFKTDPAVVSLGPVLDDSIFSTLAKNRQQLSETYYRRLSDYKTETASEVRAASPSAGGIVVLPPSEPAQSLRELVGGEKTGLDE